MTERPKWMAQGACKGCDVNLFFPQPGVRLRADIAAAKAICATCPVRIDCLNYALALESASPRSCPGIWGGTHERERLRMKYGATPTE